MSSLKLNPWNVAAGHVGIHAYLEHMLSECIARIEEKQFILRVALSGAGRVKGYDYNNNLNKIFFQLNGTNHVLLPEGSMKIGPGQMCLIPRGTPHREERIYARGRYSHVFSYFSGQQYTYHLYVRYANAQKRTGHVAVGRCSTSKGDLIRAVVDELIELRREQVSESDVLETGLLMTLLAQLNRMLRQPEALETGHPVVMRCQQMVRNRLHRPDLSVATLADSLSLHPDYLSRLFSSEAEMSLNAYIVSMRIQLAKELLSNLNISISRVSELCGFSERGYFTKVFKQKVGATPSQFQRRA